MHQLRFPVTLAISQVKIRLAECKSMVVGERKKAFVCHGMFALTKNEGRYNKRSAKIASAQEIQKGRPEIISTNGVTPLFLNPNE
jgi:hypothetical protein